MIELPGLRKPIGPGLDRFDEDDVPALFNQAKKTRTDPDGDDKTMINIVSSLQYHPYSANNARKQRADFDGGSER